MFACNCLNISQVKNDLLDISTAAAANSANWVNSSTDEHVSARSFLLKNMKVSSATDEQQDFFTKAIGPITVNVKEVVFVRHPELVRESIIGATTKEPWILNMCIGCETFTHATDIDGHQLLMNPKCSVSERIVLDMKASPNYSTAFDILLLEKKSDVDHNSHPLPKTTDDTDEKTKRLNKNFKEIVRREINATNDRIRTYSERQISNLHAFTKQAESDYNTLLKLILNGTDFKKPELQTMPNSTLGSIDTALQILQPNLSPGVLKTELSMLSSSNTHPGLSPREQHIQRTGAGDDFVFEMDGFASQYPMFSSEQVIVSDVDELDVDELDVAETTEQTRTGISIRRPRTSLNIPQSLPISMANGPERPSLKQEDIVDEFAADPNNHVDIAASIKALARSVHGDAVFGDLPRPRFSYQI